MNRSEVSGIIFLDLIKAFDLVDHNTMMYKLQNSSSLSQKTKTPLKTTTTTTPPPPPPPPPPTTTTK